MSILTKIEIVSLSHKWITFPYQDQDRQQSSRNHKNLAKTSDKLKNSFIETCQELLGRDSKISIKIIVVEVKMMSSFIHKELRGRNQSQK